ncbi:hypothetical protein D6774_03365 [Candidatus Woesearchaeota archaeon]|nr:MAG: hypothetical protein D6774_03365 [Candidatus Woesearchaeota archaeon]
MKKRLTHDQEFQIMKIVLDKFLWIGTILILFALYQGVVLNLVGEAIAWGIAGFIIWILFGVLLVREYEIIK